MSNNKINSPQMIVQEIQSTNVSKAASIHGSKAETPKLPPQPTPMLLKPASRSMSTDVGEVLMVRMSPRDTPVRKYFDSGDYEMARAGIVSSASVGSIHACPENILSLSNSASKSRSIEELNRIPNTSLYKSNFSMSNLEE